MNIPSNLTEFLYWVKERTEKLWSVDDENCPKGFYGAKWQGLSKEQIDQVEKKYNIRFIPEHKEFLKILHTIDKKEIFEYEDDGELITEERNFFYNWLADEKEVLEIIKSSYSWMKYDADEDSQVWLSSWGIKPASLEKRIEIFEEWFSHVPALLPLTGLRYIVSDENLKWKPVISLGSSDIIVMGWDLRTYLLNELSNYLDIHIDVFDEEDQMFYPELIDEVKNIFDENFKYDQTKDIPYLKERILYLSSGWSSFGLSYYPENAGIHPIVKTEMSEEEK
ncbi:SMI1/KNR4 family protein [Chryseobacterium joostei]|uniref:SMI1/KNR4 family protein n=1 Tax=Chryseobacterium joostei TaxID=112234 RepID=A0A1N7J0I0_9FLAO|nr:SMI1/KNR4 family protein [Chryseobacterium joostei]SIS42865.1 hypothetical protein SAMN05421768_107135 [Chryseobacterium joostei]